MVNAGFSSEQAEFEKLRMAKAGPATPTQMPTIGAAGTSASAGATAVGAGSAAGAGVGPLYQQCQITHTVGHAFANLILTPGVPRFSLQWVSLSNPLPILSTLPALVDSSTPSFPVQSPWPAVLQPPSFPQLPLLLPTSRTRPFQKSPNSTHLGNRASTSRNTRSSFQFRHSGK